MKEREISIIDLLVEILLHWRMFIIWMLIGAVLLGAYSFNRSRSAIKSQQAQTVEMEREPEEWLSEEEIENVNYVMAYEKAYQEKKAYQEELLLMQVDHNNISKAEATIAIDAGERQKSCDIEKVYEDIILSGELVDKVAENTDMKAADISEMLFLCREGAVSDSLEGTEGISTFRIVAMHSDEAQSKNMLDAVIAFLKEKQPDLEKSLGEHEITIANQSFGIVPDTLIAEKQKKLLDERASMKRILSDTIENLSDVEKQYYNLLSNDEESEESAAVEMTSAPGVSVKYVFLGAVMAAFIYAFILFMIYIFNTKIRATDSLQELYDIPQLGMVPSEENDKKVFGFIDKWIISLRNHNKRQFTSEEALELASVAAKMAAGKETLHELSLMGSGLKEHSFDICEKIKERLKKDGIQVNILNNVLYDAQMMGELEKAKGVILVESANITLYNEIFEELELLKRQGIKVLGGILVG